MLQFRRWSKRQREGRLWKSSWRTLSVESLEERMLLTTAGYDYVLSGYRWADASHITYSVAPDGVLWNHGYNNLNSTLNASLGYGIWQRQFALALATWEAAANINIAQVADSAYSFGAYGKAQGDARFGDIRIGGYDFGAGYESTLAHGYFPPPQGTTEAGNLEINTSQPFSIGKDMDFFSIMLHETGHALGLEHSPNPASIMYYQYQGARTGLQPGDIAGIQAIYGARPQDVYQAQGQGLNWGSAIDVTARLGSSLQTTLDDVSLTKIGDTEYFTVVAPSNVGATMQVVAAAANVSMLSPKVSLYDASGRLIATASNTSAWSNTVAVDTSQVVPGQRYYIAVTGATQDAFAVGAYDLQVVFASGGQSVAPPPPQPQPTPQPPLNPPPSIVIPLAPDRFESNDNLKQATRLGIVAGSVTVANLTLHSSGDLDTFNFRNGRAGIYRMVADGAILSVFDAAGRRLAAGVGEVSIRIFRPRTSIYVQVSAPSGVDSVSYSLTLSAQNVRAKAPKAVKARAVSQQVSHWPVQPRGRLH